jgi:hypothetical protein
MKISGFKLFIALALLTLVAGSVVLIQKRNEEEARNQQYLAAQAKKDAFIRMKAKELGADYSWVKKVDALTSGGANLLTFQLEQLWITPNPILLLGEIEDIQREGSGYKIKIKNSLHEPSLFFELNLSISCPAEITEGFVRYMEEHKDEFDFEKPIAVIAKINSVVNEKKLNDGKVDDVKVGIGQCLALMPSTDNYSFQLE